MKKTQGKCGKTLCANTVSFSCKSYIFDEHDKLHPLSAAFLRLLRETHRRRLWSGLQDRIQLLWRAL
jgi:hypothetical protein